MYMLLAKTLLHITITCVQVGYNQKCKKLRFTRHHTRRLLSLVYVYVPITCVYFRLQSSEHYVC